MRPSALFGFWGVSTSGVWFLQFEVTAHGSAFASGDIGRLMSTAALSSEIQCTLSSDVEWFMREHTLAEFSKNVSRVRNLVEIYELTRAAGRGRRSVSASDTLRAAVVFLHSSLEEVVRNVFLWKLPEASETSLNEIPLAGSSSSTGRAEKFFLGKLAAHRGLFVDNVIRNSIDEFVDRLNVNNTNDLSHCLEMIGVAPSQFAQYFPRLQSLMERRHQIVHQMDRNETSGTGQHRAQSISKRQVELWLENLDRFVSGLLSSIQD
jgi:RiboL-PSP-HEPN